MHIDAVVSKFVDSAFFCCFWVGVLSLFKVVPENTLWFGDVFY